MLNYRTHVKSIAYDLLMESIIEITVQVPQIPFDSETCSSLFMCFWFLNDLNNMVTLFLIVWKHLNSV